MTYPPRLCKLYFMKVLEGQSKIYAMKVCSMYWYIPPSVVNPVAVNTHFLEAFAVIYD